MNQEPDIATILDESLSAMAHGASVNDCLNRFPHVAEELRPLLQAAAFAYSVPLPELRPEAVERGQMRMLEALRAKQNDAPATADGRSFSAMVVPLPRLRLPDWLHAPVFRVAAAAVAVVVVIVSLLSLRAPWQWLPAEPNGPSVVVAEAHGEVMVRAAGAETWVAADSGDALRDGGWVRTQPDASARLTFAGAIEVEMQQETEIGVIQVPDVSSSGKARPGQVQAASAADNVSATDNVSAADNLVLNQVAGQANYIARQGDPSEMTTLGVEVQTPGLSTVVTSGIFGVIVEPDGTTRLTVLSGKALTRAGDVTTEVGPGQVYIGSPSATSPETPMIMPITPSPGTKEHEDREERPTPTAEEPETGTEVPTGEPAGTVSTPVVPGTSDSESPPTEDKDPAQPGDDRADPGDDPADPGDDPTEPGDDPADPGDDPPEDKDPKDTPPGLQDRDEPPPGLEDNPNLPFETPSANEGDDDESEEQQEDKEEKEEKEDKDKEDKEP